jgi:hypothetical protein
MADFNQIVSDGNTTFNGFSSAISGLSGGTPSGAVVAFKLGGCPTGWIPSDGTSGTVDMRGRFAREDNGDSTGTIYADQFYTHTHNLGGSYLLPPINYSEFEGQSCSGCTNFIANAITGTNSQVGYTSTGNSGGETRPKNVALLYCQKS